MKTLSPASATIKRVQVLGNGIIAPRLVCQFEMRRDDVRYISQNGSSALLPLFVDYCDKAVHFTGLHRLRDACSGELLRNLVTPNRFEADWLQHLNAIDYPPN